MSIRSAEAAGRSGRAACRASRSVKSGKVRRGGVLFEIVLSIALFAGAAAFALGAVRSAFDKLDQTRRRQQAIDLARSKIAELEAGLISIADLRDGASPELAAGEVGGNFDESRIGPNAAIGGGWSLDVQVHRSEFPELSLVELTVSEQLPGSSTANETGMHYTLRQLVKLRDSEAESYEEDPMSEPGGGGYGGGDGQNAETRPGAAGGQP